MLSTPRPLAAARILLWGMAGVLLLTGATAVISDGAGGMALNFALMVTMLAAACGAYAYFLPRTGHIMLGVVVTLLVLFAFYQISRITGGSVAGFLGFGFCVAVATLLLMPSSREALRS